MIISLTNFRENQRANHERTIRDIWHTRHRTKTKKKTQKIK